MNDIEFLKQYLLCIILLIIGLLFLFITYIGAPLQSKRSGKFVSGVPGIGGLFIAAAFLTTPNKWLMLLGLLDWKILWLIFKVIPDSIRSEKDLKKRQFPDMINDEKIIAYTGYKSKYSEVRKPHEKYENTMCVYSVCYYAISECNAEYALLSVDVKFDVLNREVFKTMDECKKHISPEIKWFEK